VTLRFQFGDNPQKKTRNADPNQTKSGPTSTTSRRIKSWEYEKWDKFDVEDELSRMEVRERQNQEWEKVQKPKIQLEERMVVEKLMRNGENEQKDSNTKAKKNVDSDDDDDRMTMEKKVSKDVSSPSFIEEIVQDSEPSAVPKQVPNPESIHQAARTTNARPHRRVRVQIEDVHIC